MSKQSLKKWALLLTFWVALHTTALKAQTVLYSGTSPAVLQMEGTSGILEGIGTYGTGSLSLSGAGTRLVWYPGKAAFRAGYVNSTQWDDANIGTYSAAFGYETLASGGDSVAFGSHTNATGFAATTFGSHTTASGVYATAWGEYSTATGNYSTAFGMSTASGNMSTSWGTSSVSGAYSTASGISTSATAYDSFVIGTYNVGGGTSGSWVSTDPLFEVGNGTSGTHADALVVYKNGIVAVHTEIRTNAAGDISMGSFTAGTAP